MAESFAALVLTHTQAGDLCRHAGPKECSRAGAISTNCGPALPVSPRYVTVALWPPCAQPPCPQALKERDLLRSKLEAAEVEAEREAGLHRRELRRKAKEWQEVGGS